MDCSVIYYSARKTSVCEKALGRAAAPLGLRVAFIRFATDASALGECLREAFRQHAVCFVVGGLGFSDFRSVSGILANAAARSKPELLRRLPNPEGDDGFVLRAGGQLLVLLPDDPAQLEEMLRGKLSDFIKNSIQ
ncbi:MAG: hypothetical protein ABS876_08775 [Ruminococcus sp.]